VIKGCNVIEYIDGQNGEKDAFAGIRNRTPSAIRADVLGQLD
jgi:hypothetical protein